MWICLNNAFLSIVDKDCKPDELLVRARRPGDIERVFAGAKVSENLDSDYRYRATIKRQTIAATMTSLIDDLHYPNFKSSVHDDDLHTAYNRTWGVMADLQPTPPYHGYRTARAARRR